MSGVKRDNLQMLADVSCIADDYHWQAYLLRQRIFVLQQENNQLREERDAAMWLVEYADDAVNKHKIADRAYKAAAVVVQQHTNKLLKK